MAYTRNTWTDGDDTIVASKLNNMEAGIAANADAIDELNTNQVAILNFEESNNLSIGSANSCRLYRYGNVVTFLANLNGTLSANKSILQLLTIDSGFRPLYNVVINYSTQEGYPMMLQINTSGVVNFYLNAGTLPSSSFWICRQCITYIVAP